MKWEQLLSSKRLGRENDLMSPVGGRSPYESDLDRIIFSGAFRRLSRKTQVHPLAANDHVHTRLTHSLEVAQVGRSLGKSLGLKIADQLPSGVSATDLGAVVQAACLAHDIGNPPFGHGGEEAMTHWFEVNGSELFGSLSEDYKRDLIGFDGNAQGFRVLTETENHLFSGGIQLTYATLGSFLKYPWTCRKYNKKFSVFLTEETILEKIAEELGMVRQEDNSWARHPLTYLVEAADDICYGIIDLEDAVELKIVPYLEVEKLLLSEFDSERQKSVAGKLEKRDWHRVNLARLRGPVFDFVVSGVIDAFIRNYDNIMAGTLKETLFETLPDDDSRKKLIEKSKDFAARMIFSDPKKVEIELGAYATLECLLNSFCRAALDCSKFLNDSDGEISLSWRSRLILKLLGDHAPSNSNAPPSSNWSEYQCLRRVLDFISGMTDNYATYIAKQIQGMGFAGMQRP